MHNSVENNRMLESEVLGGLVLGVVVLNGSLIKCKKCGIVKKRDGFYWKKSGRKAGKIHSYTCKICVYASQEAGDIFEKRNTPKLLKCNSCKIDKDETTEYYYRRNRKRLGNICIECARKKRKEYYDLNIRKPSKKLNSPADTKKRQTEYRNSLRGRKVRKNYMESEDYKKSKKKSASKYASTEAGKATKARSKAKRRSKIENTSNNLTKEQWACIRKEQNYQCNGCKSTFSEEKPATRDHIIPVENGGGLTKDNVQALCQSCNSTKGTKPMDFLIETLKEKEERKTNE